MLLDPNAGIVARVGCENVDPPGTVTPLTPGEMRSCPRTDGGRFRVWIRGSFGRPDAAYIDGRRVGEAGEINTPGQWQQVGEVELAVALIVWS